MNPLIEERVFEIDEAGCHVRVHVKVSLKPIPYSVETFEKDGYRLRSALSQIHMFLEKAWREKRWET